MLEGVVNALIHRNYLEIGSEVHIDMFDDRIEIYSPGGMVSGISLEGKNLLKIPSKRRNPILADIFSRLNIWSVEVMDLRRYWQIMRDK